VLPANAGTNLAAGCAGPAGETVAMIDPMGSEATTQFPCFEHPTLADLLDANRITWRYYAPSAGSIWTGPNAIQHLRFGADWQNVIIPQTTVLTDIAAGQLAQVTWVIPDGRASDHPSSTDGSGPSWVASIVNAIGNSPFWSSTAIFITWDDWGGWYDHVAPTIHNSYEYGFRVPLIVLSPYAKKRYVSHVTHDFGSLLHFTESTFGLPSLGYADALADDLSDCFDFSQTPATFQSFAAKFDVAHFLSDRRTPLDPDDD
jgi:phospholipase C